MGTPIASWFSFQYIKHVPTHHPPYPPHPTKTRKTLNRLPAVAVDYFIAYRNSSIISSLQLNVAQLSCHGARARRLLVTVHAAHRSQTWRARASTVYSSRDSACACADLYRCITRDMQGTMWGEPELTYS